ncbi:MULTISPECIES: DUF2851 family protein [Bacteroides]|jgi:hypothetical protein|uniref:DUF2851 family protein n=1 Tax=Bacteroides TaxID=816 RepID=UPI0007602A7F|nr:MULTISPECIES: DUF2851 family protein [Bacteroides]MBV3638058.1 DUF2851 family protein [Bacteroides cellulosilyticus]MBV3664409.1 DUF2851 family protein [Bacteroides cellulosilyticus]MBV3686310.1 DUF2851 family protein [Bacteroides cellulosilyticus]MBV3695031.1 DUF2851 family protein [Bacteroides cellulosilyticus]MBV3708671.1 DUF2851 family protein [Bacteroides cellulosilyticus]
MELLLHYVWKHKIFPLKMLQTTTGEPVEVIDAGLPNTNAGPDFFNAKLKIGGTLWVGNIEVHILASDWMRHGHDKDAAYDNVILHVAETVDCEVFRANGIPVPQLQLSCPESVRQRYDELSHAEIYPPCYSILSSLPKLTVHSWLSALQVERFEQKAHLIATRLERCNNHWEDVFFITLARNFGFGLNGDAFEAWASRLPFRAIDKHRDNLFQVEAFFFGQAGLLDEELPDADGYYLKLQKEFRYLQHKFELSAPMAATQWRFLRLRPGNFPHVRLAQLANLYYKEQSLFSRIMEADTLEAVRKLLAVTTSPYWEEHFNFRKVSSSCEKQVGKNAQNLIVINTVIPFLYAYGLHKADELLCERATGFLESLKAEDNHIIRHWSGAGLPVSTAADSQALLQLQKEYCDKKDCLRCRFGFEYLRQK